MGVPVEDGVSAGVVVTTGVPVTAGDCVGVEVGELVGVDVVVAEPD